ncbi:type II toxin-antitoxin system VapC family toxin [Methylomonas sp. DH-1]|uniref:type II toxin-antitoxin system VapC family toxin n=1 Tax=Methylomonas sp. (strain DH-1) TaxID=1727196 RepID=UPI0007C8DB29|nr:type II toxin-antitoxin system VapC family toxin [Methylomonas sp. DH-1]ANE54727.1 twitching motility protein PilT [Methylomonas sp. DH-1]
MKYLLDSNACIVFLNKRSEKLKLRLEQCQPQQIVLCSVVKAELLYGAMKSQNPVASMAKVENFCSHFQSLPFDDIAAEFYGKIRSELSLLGTPIGANDFMIAAIALANDVTLISHNTREFSRVSNLLLQDWEL